MELSKAIKERRSIRRYKSDPVADTTILECIEAARLAPSWANTQVWRFIVVKDRTIKEALAEALTSPTLPGRPCSMRPVSSVLRPSAAWPV